MVLQRSSQNSRLFNQLYVAEMNEAPGDDKADFSFNKDILQPQKLPDMSQNQEKPLNQGSTASLESTSFVDQSEEQPLTEVHVCNFEECHKFRENKTDKDTTENPSTPLKNAALVLVIVLLILWIIVYAVLSQLKVL